MKDFHDRLAQRKAIIGEPSLWFWTPAFNKVLGWLANRVPSGGTVLELGCGLGFVLHTLRRRGFLAIGLDVAQSVVELNRADGFQIWHGPVERVPEGWATPDAIVMFFMLHHLEDPMGFLRTVKAKWPTAPIAIAQYGPSNRDVRRSSPPRALTRWSEEALVAALKGAGYEPQMMSLHSTGSERKYFNPLRLILSKTVSKPVIYRLNRRIEKRLLVHLLRPLRRADYVLVAMGEPTSAA